MDKTVKRQPRVGQYFYTLRGRWFHIYRYVEVNGFGSSASPVDGEPTFLDREQARKRVYELNGWRYVKR